MSGGKTSTLLVGAIVAPHGITGEVRFKSHLVGNIELTEGADLFLCFPDGVETKKRLLYAREGSRGLILRLEGVESANEAEKYRGVEVSLDEKLLPPPGEGEYYWRDLVGLDVFLRGEDKIGKVVDMMEGGGYDILVVETGGNRAMIPFVESMVISVDPKAGKIIVDPPEGLLELAE